MIIGVYGNRGVGKSTVSQYLANNKQFLYLELDQVAKKLELENQDLLNELKELKNHGLDVLNESNTTIDYEKMKLAIFGSLETNQQVSTIIWKYVRQATQKFIDEHQNQNIVIEAAILPALKIDSINYYFYIKADKPFIKKENLLKLEEIQNYYNSEQRKDFVIKNNHKITDLYHQVDLIIKQLNF